MSGALGHHGLGRRMSRAEKPCGEPEGMEGMRYTQEVTQRASKKGGKGRINQRPYQPEPQPGAQGCCNCQVHFSESLRQSHAGGWQLLCVPGLDSLRAPRAVLFPHLLVPCTIPALPCPAVCQSSVFCLFRANKVPTKTSFHIEVTYGKYFLK